MSKQAMFTPCYEQGDFLRRNNMKTLILAIALLVGFSVASAGYKCKYDYFGNYVCTGTGADLGFRSTQKEDYFGNDVYKDNQGNQYKCHTDYFGNYVCN